MIDDLLDDLIRREGGYVDHPEDRGGPTKYGITAQAYAAFFGHFPRPADIEGLNVDTAKAIYRKIYLLAPGFDVFQEPVRTALFDFGVHSGPVTAIRQLQVVLGTRPDGIIGPITREVFEDVADVKGVEWLAVALHMQRLRYLADIVVNDPTQLSFLRGWTNRVATLAIEAMPA